MASLDLSFMKCFAQSCVEVGFMRCYGFIKSEVVCMASLDLSFMKMLCTVLC